MSDLTKLRQQVENLTNVDASVLELIQGLAQEVKDLPADQEAIDALADKIQQQADSLSAAVTANTKTNTGTGTGEGEGEGEDKGEGKTEPGSEQS